ncbi:MAG TPA: metallophosphoesterase family protein [Puia sp.]|uniref:metallophosphoesterase family protein n=1 Tax=Puia sp. TaxID=2045100 RepID=UPI002CCCFAC7|nr:metallophosphoesterase family protein [Puia sp.]HVU94200.1 metallophosphoesterase family protein [Puia sp.]
MIPVQKYTALLLLALAALAPARAQQAKPILHFNAAGKFRIIQFTDTHFQFNSIRSDSVKLFIRQIIEKERPDLVVFTGDIVCSPKATTREGWLSLTQPLVETKTPWAITFGNHDAQYDMTRQQIMQLLATIPYNLSVPGPPELSGCGNYTLEVKANDGRTNAALLYLFDSHEWPFDRRPDRPNEHTVYGEYDWIRMDQIQWYRNTSQAFTHANHDKALPALAFFHIPLPEFKDIIGNPTTVGFQGETVCSPDVNSGLFASFIDMKDVMGVFCGHDHNNNYIGCRMNIALSYGCVTGRECYGITDRGARIIELTEGQRKFDTWLYTTHKTKKFMVSYPDSFISE